MEKFNSPLRGAIFRDTVRRDLDGDLAKILCARGSHSYLPSNNPNMLRLLNTEGQLTPQEVTLSPTSVRHA